MAAADENERRLRRRSAVHHLNAETKSSAQRHPHSTSSTPGLLRQPHPARHWRLWSHSGGGGEWNTYAGGTAGGAGGVGGAGGSAGEAGGGAGGQAAVGTASSLKASAIQ